MLDTTLCYIVRDGKFLMLHRIKKAVDVNKDKWVGIGGKFLPGETPEACARREILEETGLSVGAIDYRGTVDFRCPGWPEERMHLFWIEDFSGTLKDCDEGVLEWIDQDQMDALPQWEGDRIFFRLLMEKAPFFHLALDYEGDTLVSAVLNGTKIK